MIGRTVTRWTLGVLLIVTGSVTWLSRNNYSSDEILSRREFVDLAPVTAESPVDLSTACSSVQENEGWLLFVIDMNTIADNTARRYFQTSPEPFGLFIEYDPGESAMLRVGFGLGPEKWNSDVRIRTVRNDETMTIAIGVRNEETRIVSNVIDQRITWPGEFASLWKCDAVQVGSWKQPFVSGAECEGCRVAVRYMSGSEATALDRYLDQLSNLQRHNRIRWIGTILSLAGFFLLGLRRRDVRSKSR
jgi:hypothetical protein